MTIEKIRIIGAGAMGRGIAQVAATAGVEVEITDVSSEAVSAALEFVTTMLRRSAEKGQRTEADAEAAVARLHAGSAPTAPAGDIDLVIEAVVERLDVKQSIFTELETVAPGAILASNTSSLSITAIGAVLRDPTRLLGLHFFNPVPLMKLVEVVPGLRTDPALVDVGREFVARLGHTAVLARDTPGFLVNHLGRGLPTEAFAVLSEQTASAADIDRVARETLGLKMGPFELMDLTGLDVSHPVMETVSAGFYGDPRLRPSPIAAGRVAAGLLGRKTGEGFYPYLEGRQEVPAEPRYTPDAAATAVYVHEDMEFADMLRAAGVLVCDTPAADAVSLVLPVGEPTYRAALAADLDPARTVGVDPLGVAGGRLTVTVPATLDPAVGTAALNVLAATGRSLTVTADGPAPIAQRLLASIVNVSCAIAEHGIGSPADIDLGARLGLGYPQGPLTLGDTHGATFVLRILDGLLAYTGDPRYRASGWLRTRADLGLSLCATGTRPTDL